MASAVKVSPLDDAEGYLRWKESMLLRLRIVRVAHVLTEDPPAGEEGGAPAAAKQWAHDDALCRGYILATLSDRVFPDYVRHATARELWDAVARTYDVGTSQDELQRMLREFAFDVRAPLLEQVAHAEALGARLVPSFGCLAYHLRSRHPVFSCWAIPLDIGMDDIWRAARLFEEIRASLNEDQLDKLLGDLVKTGRFYCKPE